MQIPVHNFSIREKTVADILRTCEGISSFINVGFHNWEDPRRHWWIKICDLNNVEWKIVEIYGANVTDAIKKGCPPHKIIQADILDVPALPEADCLLFWHGPEHVTKEKFLKCLPALEQKYKILILGMPLGDEPQGPVYGNEHEEHVSSWLTKDWEDLGYEVIEIHDSQKYPHITVYKVRT